MKTLWDSIGDRWEDVLQDSFPSLVKHNSKDGVVPDFYHPKGFWLEAKAGNRLWGGRVKPLQVKHLKRLDKPTVYAFGMHDLDNATEIIDQDTEEERRDFLEREMRFVQVYFVSGEVIRRMFNREKRVSKKTKEVYCMLKPSMLRNVILDRPFRRFGQRIPSTSRFYGFNRSQYEMGFEDGVGFILHRQYERAAIRALL